MQIKISAMGIGQWCHTALIYQGAGRGGDIAQAESAYPHVLADAHFGGIHFDWTQMKTAKFTSLITEICWSSMPCIALVTFHHDGHGSFPFPDFQEISRGVATKVQRFRGLWTITDFPPGLRLQLSKICSKFFVVHCWFSG